MARYLRGLFEHKRLKPASLGTSEGYVYNLAQLKQIINAGLKNINRYINHKILPNLTHK